MSKGLEEIEKIIEYSFDDKNILREALTHSSKGDSRTNGTRMDYERLEFIGDAMLDAIIGVILFRRMPSATEGELTKLRAQIVCEESLNRIGQKICVGSYIILGDGEEKMSGREKPSVIADVVEAIIGGIYLDSGYDEVWRFVEGAFSELVEEAISGKLFRDYKTKLQEIAHKNKWNIEYSTRSKGPDHDKTFFVQLLIDGKVSGEGIGKSKKEAEQKAAESFLRKA